MQSSYTRAVSIETKLDGSDDFLGHGEPQNQDQNMQKQIKMAANPTIMSAKHRMGRTAMKLSDG
jgi:hypothetical protein